jgi:glycerate dehydrogenase
MPRWSLCFVDACTFDRQDIDWSKFKDRWACTFHELTHPPELAQRIAGFDVVVTNKVVLDANTLKSEAAKSLKLIAVAAAGTNNIDLNAARERGIPVCNAAGYSGPGVAQHAFALILELVSHAGAYSADVKAGAWEKSPIFTLLSRPVVELRGKTLGLIGSGDIGSSVAKIAEGFGMNVILSGRKGAAPAAGRVAFEDVLKQSDVISLHCPLTPETKDLIGAKEFALMKPSAFLVNTARGGIVNEAALIEALRTKRIAGAGFDVLTQEPPKPDHALLQAAKTLDNLVLTPHSAWTAYECRTRLLDEVYKNIVEFEGGRERNRIK